MGTYLTNMPTEVLSQYGLNKTLLTRRETIHLKHIMTEFFLRNTEEKAEKTLSSLGFSSVFQYSQYITNKLRGIYWMPREIEVGSSDDIVKTDREGFFRSLELYKTLNPVVIIDYTLLSQKERFLDLYGFLTMSNKVDCEVVVLGCEHRNVMKSFISDRGLISPKTVKAVKNKEQSIRFIRKLAEDSLKRTIFYIGNNSELLDLSVLLGVYCYKYNKNNKVKFYTGFSN